LEEFSRHCPHKQTDITVALIYKISFLIYFLPILGGQKATVLDSAEGWCAADNLGASRVSIRMDDRTDGQRTDDKTDDETHGFKGGFISHPDVLYYIGYLSF